MSTSKKHKAENQSNALGVVTIPQSSDPGSSRLERLPGELLNLLSDHLNKDDLVSLICTSQTNHSRVKPILDERKLIDAYQFISIKYSRDWLLQKMVHPVDVIERFYSTPTLCRFVEHVEVECPRFQYGTDRRHFVYYDKSIRDSVIRHKFLASLVDSLNTFTAEEASQMRKDLVGGSVLPASLFLLTMLPKLTKLTLSYQGGWDVVRWVMIMIHAMRQNASRTPDEMTADGRILAIDQPRISFPSIVTLSIHISNSMDTVDHFLPLFLIPTLKHCRVTGRILDPYDDVGREAALAWPQGESKSCMLKTLVIEETTLAPSNLVALVNGMPKLEIFKLGVPTIRGFFQLAHGHPRNAHDLLICLKDHHYNELQRDQRVLNMDCEGKTITMTYSKKSE